MALQPKNIKISKKQNVVSLKEGENGLEITSNFFLEDNRFGVVCWNIKKDEKYMNYTWKLKKWKNEILIELCEFEAQTIKKKDVEFWIETSSLGHRKFNKYKLEFVTIKTFDLVDE